MAPATFALNDEVFLQPATKIEPLVCGWYAWAHLVAPVQRAMNIAFRHIPLLQSFSSNPSVHVAATQDPAMFGGPFVHLPAERAAEVKHLLERTFAECAKLIRLAKDLKELDMELQNSGRGYSLSEFYARLPRSLAGLTEFLYDTNNHPKLRFFEELVYDEYLNSDTQEVLVTSVPERQRPFFMSTPRLPAHDAMILAMPFTDEKMDFLASLRTRPAPLAEIAGALRLNDAQTRQFSQFLTAQRPQRNDPDYSGDDVRLRYFGHACVLIQTARTSILIDPMLAWDAAGIDARLTFNDLPDRIDYVVLSHGHQDHCSPEMLLQLRHRIGHILVPANNCGSIADPSLELFLQHLGFRSVRALRAFDRVATPDCVITSLPFPGEHVDLDIHTRHGIFIEAKQRRLAFLVDSDGWDPALFRRIAQRIGKQLDALFIGMECHGAPLSWLYGPLLTRPISRRDDESRRLSGLDSERAWKVLQELSATNVFVYAMGQEPWLRYIMGLEYTPDSIQLKEVAALLARCQAAGQAAENLFISKQWEL
jgi:L-ascorbate metabolism protein UlaG (beta-lactamase superfamily)